MSGSLSGETLVNPEGMFDGDLTGTYAENDADNQEVTLTFDNPTDADTVELFVYMDNGTITLTSDDGSSSVTTFPNAGNYWSASLTVNSGVINTLTWSCTTDRGNGGTYTGLKVNNRLLIDGSLVDGDNHVEYQTNGGEGEIVSVNTDDNTILLSDTGDRDNRWIAENKAATDFYVAGPDIVDEPLLTADVELESSIFSTTPPGTDSLKNIVWELNGVTQDAGLTNPYKPTLSTDTTYTVRVKHQGNSLADSAWSTSTTFTTGATRNLYTYYKERVELLESRLASIEADEVNDDATDTLLINTVANLIERVEQLEGGN